MPTPDTHIPSILAKLSDLPLQYPDIEPKQVLRETQDYFDGNAIDPRIASPLTELTNLHFTSHQILHILGERYGY